jgi:hypothetical protein
VLKRTPGFLPHTNVCQILNRDDVDLENIAPEKIPFVFCIGSDKPLTYI